MKNLKRLCLEVSLKPFKSTAQDYIDDVCYKIFNQWKKLCDEADSIALMLWTADGSEILEYNSNMNDKFEWARFIGGANRRTSWDEKNDPKGRGLHTTHYDYMENPPVMHYSDLKNIISSLKRIGKEVTGKEILVGETFDPGPEFALSDFKYNRHNEICEGASMGAKSMVCCYYTLNADDRSYAAYPNGIPEGTLFGEFLGKQAQIFLKDMGFDYIWLSNGFGFGTETWGVTGALYNGKQFFSEKVADCEENISLFWKSFRENCDYPIETRGTNLTLGIDYSSDAVNHKMIYESVENLLPPPNSPWAALDGNFGLELAGYMSRAAELPSDDYLFRFYIHDPWWLNSPWLDRYEGKPHDIYLPMSCARIDSKGKTVVANHLNVLSIDNSYGDMPDIVPEQTVPYLIGAYRNAPDAPSPLVWVYPFKEYSENLSGRLEKSFFEDWYLIAAINRALPLSTVISTDNFVALREKDSDFLKDNVLVIPVPNKKSKLNNAVIDFVKCGGKALLYGSTKDADENLLSILGICRQQELKGEFSLKLAENYQSGLKKGNYPHTCYFDGVLTDGGLSEAVAENDETNLLAFVEVDGEKRSIAHSIKRKEWNGGVIAWCRGKDCSRKPDIEDDAVKADSTNRAGEFPIEALLRELIADFGYKTDIKKHSADTKEPVIMMHRNNGAVWYSGYCPDTTVEIGLKTPIGAPLFFANETHLNEEGQAVYHMPRAWQYECRVFVEQKSDRVVNCTEAISTQMGIKRRIAISGLKDATLYILPENNDVSKMHILLNSKYPHFVGDEVKQAVVDTVFGKALKVEGATGTLLAMYHTEDYAKYND